MDSPPGNGPPPPESPPGDDNTIKVTVTSVMQGVKQLVLNVKSKETIQELKTQIEIETDVLAKQQVLLYKGKELKEPNKTIADYGITGNATITMNVKMSTGFNPTATDMILMMPPIFPSNQDQLRKQIKGMNTPHRKPKKLSGTDATANIWTPEKQMEHELTRNRMKTLLRRKKHAPILSGTPCESEAGSVQSFSPVATPPSELTGMSPSAISSNSASSVISYESGEESVVTEKELKVFFDPPETVEEYKRARRSMYLPPSTEAELLDYLKKFEEERKTKCNTCFKKLSAAQQTMRCKCTRIFCDRHRRPQNHTCVIDYKQDGRIKLKKQHSKVGDGGIRKAKFEEKDEKKHKP
uniref:Ubiquitin-like domain-containing protein n=1 Tax=Caenorhabditis tropicalis TaxID=1561998 RepID=A0A1I7URA4_9PELO